MPGNALLNGLSQQFGLLSLPRRLMNLTRFGMKLHVPRAENVNSDRNQGSLPHFMNTPHMCLVGTSMPKCLKMSMKPTQAHSWGDTGHHADTSWMNMPLIRFRPLMTGSMPTVFGHLWEIDTDAHGIPPFTDSFMRLIGFSCPEGIYPGW